MTIIVSDPLNVSQQQSIIDENATRALSIAFAGKAGSFDTSPNNFTFFAGFDGTNNGRDLSVSGLPQSTNVAALIDQLNASGLPGNVKVNYYQGLGTEGTLTGSSFLPGPVTAQAIRTAENAYEDFCRLAITYLTSPGHASASVSVALASFSRGDASAAIFSQLVYERGVIDPQSNVVYVPPGQVNFSGGVLFDPVTTGVGGNLGFAPNAKNLAVIVAANEYRTPFEGTDYHADTSQFTTQQILGDHVDIGGGYDNGIGALTLQAATDFLKNSGLNIAFPSVIGRDFVPSQTVIHEEDKLKIVPWPHYGVFSTISGSPARRFSTVPINGIINSSGATQTQSLLVQTGATVTVTTGQGITGESVESNLIALDGTDEIRHFTPVSGANTYQLADDVDFTIFRTSSEKANATIEINNDNFNIQFGSYGLDELRLSAANGIDIGTAAGAINVSNGGTVTKLTGAAKESSTQYQWIGSDGQTTYTFTPDVEGAAVLGTMVVTGGQMGSASNKLVIYNFNLAEAEQQSNGFLGIKLGGVLKISQGTNFNGAGSGVMVAKESSALQVSHTLSAAPATYAGGSSKTFTISLDAPTINAEKINIQLSGAAASDFDVDLGKGETALNADGSFWVPIAAGQSEISFTLIDVSSQDGTSDLASGASLELTANITDPKDAADTLSGSEDIIYSPSNVAGGKAAKNYTSLVGHTETSGITTFTGDSGNDIAVGSDPKDFFYLAGSVDDSISGGSSANTIIGGTGNDIYNLSGTTDLVTLGNGKSTLSGSAVGKDTIYGASGNALISGNGGTDLIILAGGTNQIFAGTKTDLATAISQVSSETASGVQGDLLAVGDGNNTIVGGLGNDLVTAGAGHDVIVLGPGNNTFLGGLDISNASASWRVSASGAHDSNILPTSVYGASNGYVDTYAQPYNGVTDPNTGLPIGVGNDTIYTGNGNDDLLLGNGSNYVQLGNGSDNVYGGMGNDTIVLGGGADYVHGGGGTTYIQGGSGSDTIYGGDGDNVIIGGSGASTIISAQGPTDTYAGDSLENNYVYGGSGNDLIFGSAGHDTLIAGSGNTTIQGGTGTAQMYGGSGKDALAALSGSATISAGSGANSLYGGTGTDSNYVLYGGSGSDYILGGSGTNVLYAGDGGVAGQATSVHGSNDSNSQTTIYGGGGVDTLTGGAGTTVIYAGDGGSSAAPDTVAAGSGDTTLYGGNGTDILQGGSGTDLLYAGGGGTDAAPTTVIAGSGISSLYGGGGSSILQDIASGEDLITAGSADDTVLAMGNDTVVAGTGADVLQNQGGNLTIDLNAGFGSAALIFPGGGQDNLVFGTGVAATDFSGEILNDSGGGTDLVLSGGGSITVAGGLTGNLSNVSFADGVTTTMGMAVRALVATPSSDANLEALLQVAFGGDSIVAEPNSTEFILGVTDGESLSGGHGNGSDTISSWGSNSSISGGTIGYGSVIYAFGDNDSIRGSTLGTDAIHASGSGDSITALVNDQITVSGANDVVQAGSGNDSITATGLNDTLIGGTGNAAFYVGDASTTIEAPAVGGSDTIYSSVSYSAPANIAALVLTGNGNLSATGNSSPMTLVGGAGNDTLAVGAGSTAATLVGGTGSTVFVVNSANDVIVNTGGGSAIVESSASLVLPSSVTELIFTGTSALTGTGNALADTLIANTGLDTLVSGSGNDLFVAGNAGDTISNAYTTNSDTIQSAFSFVLPAHIDTLVLTGVANLSGTANGDADTLVSNSGVDTFTGGTGNDTFVVNNTGDQLIDASTTANNIALSSVNFALPAHVNALTLTGTAALQATGNAAGDVITANSGNDTLTALSTTAATTLIGGTGNVLFVINNAADSIQVAATNVNDTLSASVNVVAPTNVNTVLLTGTTALQATANAAGDTLVSNSGVDTLTGGAGNDVFVVNNTADVLLNVGVGDTIESSQSITVPSGAAYLVLTGSSAIKGTTNSGNNEITGNAGSDTLVATTGQDTLVAGTGVATLVAGTGNDLFVVNNVLDVVSLSGAHGLDTVSSSVSFTLPANVNSLLLTGSANLVGTAISGNNLVTGNAGNDTIKAGSGVDTLIAGPNATTLVGGAGSGVFEINSAADVIQNLSSTGLNTVISSVGYVMQTSVSVLTLTGSANLAATGNAASDTLSANTGNDTLTAGSGAALLLGGRGADVFVVNSTSDVVSDAFYGSKPVSDTIQSSVSFTLPGSVDNLVLTGSDNLAGTANQNSDVLVGNAGLDTLYGGQGNDTLVAGSGATTMVAGAGNDTFVVNSATDSVSASAPGHHHVVNSSVSFTLPSNVNTLLLSGSSNITGRANSTDDSLVAGAGADTLYAGAGNDTLVAGSGPTTLVGGTGNDVFVVNNTADSVGGASATSTNVLLSSVGFTLPANVNTLVLTGPTAVVGQGNAAADSITGGTGADTLIAGGGIATLIGGSGNTTFVVNNSSDKVVDAFGSAANQVQSSVNFVLPVNVNEIVLTGSTAVSGTGNAAADTLLANSGLDTLVSGSGNDLFVVGNASDTISNAYTTNSDTIQSAFSFVLPAHIDTLVLTGAANLSGTANGDADTLVSNSGVDTFTGGTGNDTFVVNNTGDQLIDASTTANNIALSSVNFALPAHVNALTLTGTAALQATGNAAGDVITANSGNDTLTALSTAAATTLIGGTGNDLFVINNAADSIQVATTNPNDTLNASVSVTAPTNVNTVVLSGTAALQATANAAGDTLVSNSGVDTLVGGAGNDVFVVNNSADVLVSVSAEDTIQSSVPFALTISGAQLQLIGTAPLSGSVQTNYASLAAPNGNDTLTATGQYDTLIGGAGNDTFVVNDTSDTVVDTNANASNTLQSANSAHLSANVDTLVLTGTNDIAGTGNLDATNVLNANQGNDVLIATAVSNTIYGGSGSDTIYGGPSSNLVHAGTGGTTSAPTLVYGSSNSGDFTQDVLYGDTGVNKLWGGTDTNTIVGGSGTLAIYAGGYSNLITVGSGGTTASPVYVYGNQNGTSAYTSSTINGGTGVDVIYGGAGSDLITAGAGGSTTVYSGAGFDTVYGAAGSLLVDTLSGNDLLVAGAGSETLQGTGFDTLVGGTGTDLLSNNVRQVSGVTYEFNSGFGQETITSALLLGEQLAFGAGLSTGTFTTTVTESTFTGQLDDLVLNLHSATGSIAIVGGLIPGAISGVTFADTGSVSLAKLVNAGGVQNTLIPYGDYSEIFSAGDAQTVNGSNAVYDIFAFGNSDVINANGLRRMSYVYGDGDTLNGGGYLLGNQDIANIGANSGVTVSGANATISGTGNDFIALNTAPASLTLTGSNNTIISEVSFDLVNGASSLTLGNPDLIAHSNPVGGVLVGSGAYDTLVGSSGADTLISQAANEVLIGGSGAETYGLADPTDVLVYGTDAAQSVVKTSFSYTLGAGANTLLLGANGALGQANSGDDLLVVQYGSFGDRDTLVAGVGNDTLENADLMIAGSGNDLFVAQSGQVVVDNFAGTNDTIQASGNYVLPVNVNTLVMTHSSSQGKANSANDLITSSAANSSNTLIAGAGHDTLVGDSGGDTFVINPGFTQDVIQNVQRGDVLLFGSGVAQASVTANVLFGAPGTAPSVVLTGLGGAVTVQGGLVPGALSAINFADGGSTTIAQLLAPSGHATIHGSTGNLIISTVNGDSIVAGSGQDTVIAFGSNDTIDAGAGGDLVYVSGTASQVVGGGGADNLVALGANDTLRAGSGTATLTSGTLNSPSLSDVLVGGGNAQTFVVNDQSAAVQVGSGQLNDTVVSSVSYTVPANVTTMQLVGSGNIGAQGGLTGALIRANNAGDHLVSGSSVDTLVGGTGADLFTINNAADVILGADVNDAVYTSVNYTAPANVSAIIADAAGITVKGNDSANEFVGNTSSGTVTLIGGSGSDTLRGGTNGDDVLVSGSGVDDLIRGTYSTTFIVNNSADTIENLTAYDTLESAVSYVLTEPVAAEGGYPLKWQLIGSGDLRAQIADGAQSVDIVGNSGRDTLIGGGGSNYLESGSGIDVLIGGGAGSTNNFTVNNSSDTVIADTSAASNEISTTVSMTLPANVFSVVALAANVVLTGNTGDDYLFSNGIGYDTLIGGTGNDAFKVFEGDAIVLGSTFGNDYAQFSTDILRPAPVLVQFSANPGDMTISAVSDRNGNPALRVADGSSVITLEGALGTGIYQFKFGTGSALTLAQLFAQANVVSSTISGGSGELILSSAAATSLMGSAGDDTLLALGAADTITGGSGAQWLEGFGANASIVGGSASDTLEGFGTNDTLIAGAAADTLIGGTGASVLFVINSTSDRIQLQSSPGADSISSSVNDTLPSGINTLVLTASGLKGTANSGADTLIGSSTGVDTLVGGSGSDLFILNNAANVVSVGGSHGADTIQTSFNDTLAANVANLVLTGSGAVTGTGNAIADVLRANAGNDTLVAGTGVATMVGGSGNDLFVVNNTADTIQSASTTSSDTISSSVSFTLPVNVNTLVLTGSGTLTGTANTGNDLMSASATTGAVTLNANTGADTLVAGAGADTLVSGTGVDSLVGGTGSDLFVLSNSADVVTVGTTHGTDTLQAGFNDTLAANVAVLVLTGSIALSGTGNAIANVLRANSGADTLTAGSGVATLVGGTGNDLFVVNNTADTVQSASTTAVDTIVSSASFTLPVNVNTLVLTGTAALKGTGNSTGADLITAAGTSGADTLVAGNGADTLISGSGVDSLVGGTGSDLFVLNNSADVVTVGTTHGADTLQASFNDTLAANVGTLILTGGSTALMGTGNSLADTLVANAGNDTLVAGSGLAKMIGGTGNDLFVINATGDSVTAATAGVSDTIQSSVSYTLPTNVQYLKLTGTASLVGGGNGSTSLVIGNTGNDTLNGGTGVAVLEAGTAGAQVLKATGNQAAIIGGGAADTLTGGAYKDFFAAGKVGDTITTGATANVIAVNKGDGATVIAPITSASNVLSLGAGIDTEALTLTKSGNNLVLNDGVAGDSITFTNWFASTANQTTTTLQVIEAASASYNSAGSDVLRNKPIEEFNFTTLVSQFTAASSPSAWMLSQKEAADTIASSATADYGGDLAYYYGKNGNLTGMNLSASQSTLTNTSYATGLQTIDAWAGISGGTLTLNAVGGSSNAATQVDVTPVTQPTANDGRATVLPVTSDNREHAAYVNTNALVAALGTEDMPKFASWGHQRETFSALWASMHRQIDMVSTNTSVGTGAEAQAFDLAPDPVAMLSGGGAVTHDRLPAFPAMSRRQA